jgi:hypothetical protein
MGAGVGVGDGGAEGEADGNADVAGLGDAAVLGAAEGCGVTWVRAEVTDARTHPAAKSAPHSETRRVTGYAILASLRLTAEASNVL